MLTKYKGFRLPYTQHDENGEPVEFPSQFKQLVDKAGVLTDAVGFCKNLVANNSSTTVYRVLSSASLYPDVMIMETMDMNALHITFDSTKRQWTLPMRFQNRAYLGDFLVFCTGILIINGGMLIK